MKKKQCIWDEEFTDLSLARAEKPRQTGLTMVMDKGLGLTAFRDLLELAGCHLDFIKIGFGTAAVTPADILREKVALAKQHGVFLYPGGTFFEIAYSKNKWELFIETVAELGMEWMEVSAGTIDLPSQNRKQIIRRCREQGLQVVTEIGKKQSGYLHPVSSFVKTYEEDLESGASYVIVEGRENGKEIGIFDREGKIRLSDLYQLIERTNPDRLIWEAPCKDQQITLLKILGSNANFGNIPHYDILALECLRRGLRADTFASYCGMIREFR
ncbi:phosphosulfolactate synthase [Thermoactinomyces sp. CICC 10521]|uniref:phosphosulfolactate synthase n=1 Tax=Thermoactinomyces sp. CICC 10521 TaxID=2767426 RepID=UPI0018DD7D49|nr:phosphosulfolactate synthase [Thermoactinomyces sp. CICC 10521]MBH8606685.1 phosphosulfolactate synthase [Thermoactinomyces sp. CICC 10521]